MPDLLLISTNSRTTAEVQRVTDELSFRLKSAPDLGVAHSWSGSRTFDVVLVDGLPETALLQEFAERLWSSNSRAAVCVTAPDDRLRPSVRAELAMVGITTFVREHYLTDLADELRAYTIRTPIENSGFHILVADDLDSPRDIICSYIERLGFPSVTGVASGEEALQRLLGEPARFGCLVTDIQMPGMNGKELITQIRATPNLRHLPIIVLTAYGTGECLLDCLRVGATGFLVKPPHKRDLQRELSRALRVLAEREKPRLVDGGDLTYVREFLEQRGFL